MKVVDNFDLLKAHMDFGENEEFFYNVQVLQRAKDNPEIGSNNRLVKSYVIRHKDGLDNVKSEIVTLCQVFKARAYMHFTRRSYFDVTLSMIENLADRLRTNNISHVSRVHNSACGNSYDKKTKSWVIDVDEEDLVNKDAIVEAITNCKPEGDKIIVEVPTRSGVHLITKAFDLKSFSDQFPGIDVHKNNPTILYAEVKE